MTDPGTGQSHVADQTDRLHLSPRHRETLEALVREHLPGIEVWAYGSRVNGESHDGSDLDLVLRAPDLQEVPIGPLADFTEALHDSTLPFLVEARDWARLPERFHKEIEKGYVVIQNAASEDGADSASDWREVTLGDCVLINESTYSPKESWPFINYLDTGNITDNRITKIQHLIPSTDKIPSRARRKVRDGDIVYSTVRPNQRHFGLLREIPQNCLVSTGFAIIRGKENIADTEFIFWFLAQSHIVEHLHTIAEHSTSAYPSIRPSDIKQLKLRLPPLPEQRAIAHILGTLDDKIELNRRMNETLEAMARALFKSWFVDFEPVRAKMEGRWRPGESLPGLPADLYDLFPDRLVDSELGEIPEGWEWSNIGTRAETKLGGTPSRKQPTLWGGNVPWINSGKANEFRVTSPSEYITTEGFARSATKLLPKRTTLVAITGATLGQVSLTEIETCANQSIVGVRGNEEMPSEFLYFWITEYIGHLLASQTGAAQQHINKGNVNKLILLCPSSEMMKSWIKIARPTFDKIATGCFENETLAQTRDFLLPELISGEIRPHEATKTVEAMV